MCGIYLFVCMCVCCLAGLHVCRLSVVCLYLFVCLFVSLFVCLFVVCLPACCVCLFFVVCLFVVGCACLVACLFGTYLVSQSVSKVSQ